MAGRAAVTLATATAGSVALLPEAGHAATAPTIDQVRAQISALDMQAEQSTEAYDGANEALAGQQQRVDRIQGRIAAEQADLDRIKGSLGVLAAAQYESGGMDPTMTLMLAKSPDQFLEQAAALDQVASTQADSLRAVRQMQRQLTQDKQSAAAQLDRLRQTRDTLAASKSAIEADLQKEQTLLSSLTAAQRAQLAKMQQLAAEQAARKAAQLAAQLEAQQAAALKAAQQAAQAAARVAAASHKTTTPAPAPAPITSRGALAVKFAFAQLGKPYVWGATGPSSYDCSGLSQAAWAAAGVAIPRTVIEQFSAIQSISQSELQPGDLVEYYGGDHVGIYIGNGDIIHAPHTGEAVQIASMDSMPISAYGRPA